MAMRLARATGGGVDYWMSMPILEALAYLYELGDQLTQEADAMKRTK